MNILASLHGFEPTDVFLGCRYSGDESAGRARMGLVLNALQTLHDINVWGLQVYDHTVQFDDGTVVTAHRRGEQYWADVEAPVQKQQSENADNNFDIICLYYKEGVPYASKININKSRSTVSATGRYAASKYITMPDTLCPSSFLRTTAKRFRVGKTYLYILGIGHIVNDNIFSTSGNHIYPYYVYNPETKEAKQIKLDSNDVVSYLGFYNCGDSKFYTCAKFDEVFQLSCVDIKLVNGKIKFYNTEIINLTIHDFDECAGGGDWGGYSNLCCDFISTDGVYHLLTRISGDDWINCSSYGNNGNFRLSKFIYDINEKKLSCVSSGLVSGDLQYCPNLEAREFSYYPATIDRNTQICSINYGDEKINFGTSSSGTITWHDILYANAIKTLPSKKINRCFYCYYHTTWWTEEGSGVERDKVDHDIIISTPFETLAIPKQQTVHGMAFIECKDGDLIHSVCVTNSDQIATENVTYFNGIRIDGVIAKILGINKTDIAGFLYLPTA
jgi:hypothetical protein